MIIEVPIFFIKLQTFWALLEAKLITNINLTATEKGQTQTVWNSIKYFSTTIPINELIFIYFTKCNVAHEFVSFIIYTLLVDVIDDVAGEKENRQQFSTNCNQMRF